MTVPFIPGAQGFSITPTSQTAGTAVVGLIPPAPGLICKVDNLLPNWFSQPFIHLTSVLYTTAGTAHNLFYMRPLNWTTTSAAAAAAQAVINITADPGLYATKFRYPVPGVSPDSNGNYVYDGRVANNAIAANDYCAYQLIDGTWVLDTVSSVSTLAITMTTNVPTGGVAKGAPFFFFGIKTDSNPMTGLAHLKQTTIASTNKAQQLGDNQVGIVTLNPGDPLMLLSDNATAAGVWDLAAGNYTKF